MSEAVGRPIINFENRLAAIMLWQRMKSIVFQALAEAARNAEGVALCIISGAKGSSSQKVGAKALFYADGRIKGTLGGGCLEAEIQRRAVQSLRTGQASAFELLLDHDFGWDDGLICGGKVFGLILPYPQGSRGGLLGAISERESSLSWGGESEFAIGAVPDSQRNVDWLCQET